MHPYDDHPALAVWETMQAEGPARRGRRRPEGDPLGLDTSEARRLLDGLAAAHVPELVLTASDPTRRPDLAGLVAYGRSLGLGVVVRLEATPRVTAALVGELAAAGPSRLSVGLHGQGVVTHEAFNGIAGSFEAALGILRDARAMGIATEVDTTVHAGNIGQLGRIAQLVEVLEATLWNVSYLVPTGPSQARLLPRPEDVTSSLDLLLDLAQSAPFAIRTTSAPNYAHHVSRRSERAAPRARRGLDRNDERGFAFVSHGGAVYPNPWLPVHCGNVKTDDLLDIYRHHLVFRLLRTPDMLGGKCRVCGYRRVCAGSRARAYAMTQSLTGQDPLCEHVPPGYEAPAEQRRVQ